MPTERWLGKSYAVRMGDGEATISEGADRIETETRVPPFSPTSRGGGPASTWASVLQSPIQQDRSCFVNWSLPGPGTLLRRLQKKEYGAFGEGVLGAFLCVKMGVEVGDGCVCGDGRGGRRQH